ncbi:glutamine synthetase family protein [Sediminitomix flava]|uniref:L-glutamine synthetase n=1 Tax=Sediminitomix flava TaxID=379075 RepID=A0A315ZDT6_SEDFL|nr:glutamine synthetase family protein [Sediminitomix flava]PWJ42988.1 L-glutamine synthetase [Sediminitomix flava]
MSEKRKVLSADEIKEEIIKNPSNKVRVAVTDLDGVLRGKVIHKDKFLSIVEKGFGFCDVVFGWDMMDELYGKVDYTGWHTGFPDAQAHLCMETYRQIPWEDNMPFFLADFCDSKGNPNPVCPRNVLKRVVAKAEEMGYSPFMAEEFEWFNFIETPESLIDKSFHDLNTLTPGMFGYSILRSSYYSEYFNQIFDDLNDFGVPLEGLHTETGPGVYEAAIQASSALEAADRANLFKTSVKEIAYDHGLMASFMARWNDQYPGCSGHIHQSLWDKKMEKNLFYDDGGNYKMSELMRQYMAGQLTCLSDLLVMIAPTTNSYKRLVEGYWAPTTLTWGVDNRTTALRALPTGQRSCRLETRVVGSDVNPYLAFAACLASGIYGIENELSLNKAMTKGNGYEDTGDKLASSLEEATQKFKDSVLANELFGEEFVQHFAKTREWEVQQYDQVDPHWERKRYFEII